MVEATRKDMLAPIQTDKRWVVERIHPWMKGYGTLRRRTERSGEAVDLYLAAARVTPRMPICRAASRSRWNGRPTTRRLK
ncbi:hypothetical protein ACFU7T_13860 [Streptomyces sp. NPDC057555]|uniref:hypothetical protein n=1 Tax=Streptomyces sp. NPDC057555 TaxID=3346166 RepID=UPI00368CEB5B